MRVFLIAYDLDRSPGLDAQPNLFAATKNIKSTIRPGASAHSSAETEQV